MPKATETKVSHNGMIMLEQKVSEKSALPGMIVRFSYPGSYDTKPLLFVNSNDRKYLTGVNLNYLQESEVKLFFKECTRIGVPPAYENTLKLPEQYLRVQMASRLKPFYINGAYLYKNIFHRNVKFKRAFRTYKLSKASAMKAINYKGLAEFFSKAARQAYIEKGGVLTKDGLPDLRTTEALELWEEVKNI